jgi:SulP family sulfate permease
MIAIVLASVVVSVFHLDDVSRFGDSAVATVGTSFGEVPRTPPKPNFDFVHHLSAAAIRDLIPDAFTIAILAGIESLLCCVVADGMIGGRHKSNTELIAQGVSNIAAICFGGVPATSAIARTTTNIKTGGRTPLAGMMVAVFVLVAMLALAPLASKIPMASFASVLIYVAWNMSQRDHFKNLIKAPRSDVAVLLITFGLTVLVDLSVAIGVGMVLAAMLFMKRMSEVTNIGSLQVDAAEDSVNDNESIRDRVVPPGVEVYEINGPFFFGVADRLKDTLRTLRRPPKVFILRMRRVPAVDATGMHALEEFLLSCRKQGTTLLIAGAHAQPIYAMTQYGLIEQIGEANLCDNIDGALARAQEIILAK